MTTQPDEQQEPSMEEILSSIRRIIADESTEDDDREESEGEGPADEVPAIGIERAPDALVLAEPSDEDADDEGADDEGADDEGDGKDVLELTEVVRESAAVIDLDVALSPPEPFEPDTFQPEPPDQASEPTDQDASPTDEAAALDDQATNPDDHDASPDHQKSAQDDLSAGESEEPSATPWSPAAPPSDDHPPSSNITEIRNHDMANHETALQTSQNGLDELVSDQAAGAATGAFAKLSQAVQRTPPELAIADDSGRTTEQFMEDMMRPMLREWLDENLPTMVERIVQKEIQKIVRRAED